MDNRFGRITCAIGFAVLVSCAAPGTLGLEDAPFLTYTFDEFKTVFESSNLTATVINDWPRVAFYHTRDRFSPTFNIGMPAVYLFNDSDGDGMFVRSEMTHLAYLDDHHNVTWNISEVAMGAETVLGRYALLETWADIALYDSRESIVPVLERWARAHFSFVITENSTTYHNDLGSYVVPGRIDMRINFSLEIVHKVNCTGIVMEQHLKGGMSTNTFLLTEDLGLDYLVQTQALSRVDETVNGESFAHRFDLTTLPTQSVEMSKEDGTVQAHYKFSSVPLLREGDNLTKPRMNCSYYTTGSAMVLHTAYMVPDANGTVTHDMYLGIDEAGFYTGVRDWFTTNLPAILVVTGSIVAVVSFALFVSIYRKAKRENADSKVTPSRYKGQKPPEV